MESLEQKREYFRDTRTVAVYAILFRFFRPDQLSESVKVGRDVERERRSSRIMGHFDWQSTRQKPARNVGLNGQWDGRRRGKTCN